MKPMSGPMKIRGNTEFRFLLYDVLNVAGDMKIKKGYCRSTCRPVGVYLDLKARISLYCRNCEPRHFHLNQDEAWQDKNRHLTVLHVFISILKFVG